MEIATRVNLCGAVREMQEGDFFTLPCDQYRETSIRVNAYNTAKQLGIKVRVNVDRQHNMFIITRVA